ncbi:MAG TPA: hypothetical protein PLI34_17180, partial [Saprospiraceae bacterium]|nr:hypothetical protein [Saprospiraceae bacterium]
GFRVFCVDSRSEFRVQGSGFSTLKDADYYDCYAPLRAAPIIKIIKISVKKIRVSRFEVPHA